jgi:hypothetical protein
LKTYCTEYLGLESVAEKSFSSVEELGIESERTPDLIYLGFGKAFLMEFSVSNRYSSLMKTKEYYSKYDLECSLSRIPIVSYYVCLALDCDISEPVSILKQASKEFDIIPRSDVESELTDVLDTIKVMTAYIADFMPEILTMNVDSLVPNLGVKIIEVTEPFPTSTRLLGKKSFRSQRVKSLLHSSVRKLSQVLKRRTIDVDYRIRINFITRNVYLFESPDGVPKQQLIDLLDTHSSRLIDYVDVIGDVYNESNVFSKYDVDESIILDDKARPQDEEVYVDTSYYERSLKTALHKYDMPTVADCDLDYQETQVPAVYMGKLEEIIKEKSPLPYNKSPFIFYPSDCIRKGKFSCNLVFDNFIMDTIMKKAQGTDIPRQKLIDRDVDYESLREFESKNSKLWLSLKRELGNDYVKYNKMPYKKLQPLSETDPHAAAMLKFRNSRSQLSKLVKESTRTAYSNRLRINVMKNNIWEEELAHFRKEKKGIYRHVVGLDYDQSKEDYKSLLTELFNHTNEKVLDSVYSNTSPLGLKLADMCVEMRSELDNLMIPFEHSYLAHSLNLNSQMCYSLIHYSNIKLNKDDFIYDNLGNTNTLLIVKGGKTIRRTKVSRFFRLLMPITAVQAKIIKSSTNMIYQYDEQLYLLTPWRMLRLDYLKKGVELYSAFSSYYVSSSLESNMDLDDYNKFISIKVLMCFSQKRRLEVWLSTLRYIYLNSLGTHSDLLSLIESMPMLDGDSLVFILQRSFLQGYRNLRTSAKNKLLYDLIWDVESNNFDLVAERFEETIFMTKAPFNPYVEHTKNLKSMFDTHKYYLDYVGDLDPISCLEKTSVNVGEDYFSRLEENDFNFDPKSAYIVGDFIGSYIASTSSKSEMQTKLNEIFEHSYTDIATSRGMRDSKGYFWGAKGNEVVFEKMDVDINSVLKDFPKSPGDFDRVVSKSEITFMNRINELKELKLEFDMKDKRQFKDSREIFVMSEDTKLMQNPLEKFFAFLCRTLPNELIQRPSNTRPKFIHHKMFEHRSDQGVSMYCTMDCRKWAPRSNLWKYYFFVKGMAKFLPQSFVEYFLKFWSLMFNKRVRIQQHFVDSISENKSYSDIKSMLKKREDGDYELVMPYSFMMGIFNHLSSLMHAASQLYFNDIILGGTGNSSNFLAHSDDSAGVITTKDYKTCLKVYRLYEKFQRTLNHLMSRKKCCLSKRSFEMISIMYCDSRYIPMTHKFLSNVSLDLKGGGWYDDITAICGKVVDLYNSGGSYLQCYSMMLASTELLRKAYHLPRVALLSKIPLPFGGIPNFHPIHMIMVGNAAQECLLDLVEPEEVRNSRIHAYVLMAGDYTLGTAETLRYQQPFIKMYDTKHVVEEENRDLLSALATLPDQGTLIRLAKHVNKTYDKKYILSLTGFDSDQILLSTLSYKHSILSSDDKVYPLKDFVNLYLTAYLTKGVSSDVFSPPPPNNYTSYFKQTESMDFSLKDYVMKSSKSCKPVTYNTIESFDVKITQNNLLYLSAVEKDSRISNVLRNPEKFDYLRDYLMASLPGTQEEKSKYLKLYNPQEKEEKIRSGYLYLPSGVKIDTPSRFFTYSMLYTTRRYAISKRKPQLYSPAEFNLESSGFDKLKHFYLCLKLIENDREVVPVVKESLSNCKLCGDQSRLIKLVDKFSGMFEVRENLDFRTSLAFVDYNRRQRRGKNVWFASADFTLYTSFGKVTSLEEESVIWTTWEVSSLDYLSNLWGLYRIFCTSRGIRFQLPAYGHTGFTVPALAFNDFDTPYLAPLGTKAVVIPNSKVYQRDVVTPLIYRRSNKFYLGDRALDFKIYSVSDINRLTYESHSLQSLKDYIYRSDLEVDQNLLLSEFAKSKLYKLILNDDRHYSESTGKYVRNGLLGQPGSLTRALALSDEKGETRYRSSYNHSYIKKGIVEYDSVEGVPVLDMFEKVNLARLSFFEKHSFDKALRGENLRTQDRENLIRIKNKLGLEALGTAVVLHKHIFESMIAGSVVSMPKNIILDVLKCCLDAINESMSTYPEADIKYQYKGNKRAWWALVRECVEKDRKSNYLTDYLTKGLLRSKSDDPKKFWAVISSNVLLSCMNIHTKYASNLKSMVKGLVAVAGKDFKNILVDDDGNYKFKNYILARHKIDSYESDPDIVPNMEYQTGGGFFLYGDDSEDYLDMLCTEPEALDEEDMECTQEVREYDIDEECETFIITNPRSVRGLAEEFVFGNCAPFKVYNPVEYISYPWFGPGDFYEESKDGVHYYVSSFPGSSSVPTQGYGKIQSVKSHSLYDITRVDDNEGKSESDDEVDPKSFNYLPRALKSREEAVEVLGGLGIFDKRFINAIFPEKRTLAELLQSYVESYWCLTSHMKEVTLRRTAKKSYLPGFQGILEDKRLLAELKALFGDNCYHIISGNVKLTEATYKYFMRVLNRMAKVAGLHDKALILALISMMLDTSIEKESDGWFVDKITDIVEEMDSRLYKDDGQVILPVAPQTSELIYKELDIFE